MPEQSTNHRLASLLVVLFLLFTSAYMVTYSGRIASTDTLFLLDATGSLVRYGDLKLDLSAGVRPPPPTHLNPGAGYAPLPGVDAEPMQIVLAAPLFWLADHLPGIGLAHTVYLFNILVVSAAAVVICLYALALGYSVGAGVVAALLFGFGTIVWPYSKTFFQEPLTLLMLLVAALLLEKWRQSRYRGVVWLLVGLLAVAAAVLSKRAALLAVPALLLVVFPPIPFLQSWLRFRWLWLAAGVLLLVVAGVSLSQTTIVQALVRMQTALHSYLLSIGGSVWGTSPVILLALPGVWLGRKGRYGLVFAALLLAYAFGYAYVQGESWFGGLSWPPRFLIPVVPFGVLLALPVIDRALNGPRALWWRLVVIVLAAYAVWVQLSAVSLGWAAYAQALPPESGQLLEWGPGLNLVRYLRWVVIPSLWSQTPLDFAWARMNLPLWPAAFVLIALGCGFLVWRWRAAQYRWYGAGLALLLVVAIFFSLRAIYPRDPLYQASNQVLHDTLPVLADGAQPGDVALLSDLSYERFFTNYNQLTYPRLVSLPYQPGEQPSPAQPPEVVSDSPDVLVHSTTGPFIIALAETRERLQLLASSGPFVTWSVRPVERFMAAHYYPMRETQLDPRVRLIEYSTVPAPDPFALLGPEYTTDLIYDGAIQLIGYELPLGTVYAPGDVLPVSLYWRATEAVEEDYTVAWFVRDASGAPVAQGWDVAPGGGFAATNHWQAGVPLWDNRALELPSDLPGGDYRLWVVLYRTGPDGDIINAQVRGSETVDGYIGVLPAIIRVES